MPNTKPVGVAFSDPELTAGTTITGATIDSTSKIASNIVSGYSEMVQGATIATTSNSDAYVIADAAGVLTGARFSGTDALAANDTNYITFTITNLGTSGSGTATMLAATDANTTKATGGTALTANASRSLTLNGTATNLVVAAGDRLRIRAAATGTLANTVTFPVYNLIFSVS
jgi:hypothetical protein